MPVRTPFRNGTRYRIQNGLTEEQYDRLGFEKEIEFAVDGTEVLDHYYITIYSEVHEGEFFPFLPLGDILVNKDGKIMLKVNQNARRCKNGISELRELASDIVERLHRQRMVKIIKPIK